MGIFADNLFHVIPYVYKIGFNVKGDVCFPIIPNLVKIIVAGVNFIDHPFYEGDLVTYLLFDIKCRL